MKILISLMLIVTLTSCSLGGKKTIDRLYYRFPEATNLIHKTHFSIQRPTAMGILGNRPMVAQNDDGALLQLNHNFWLDSPKVLLQNYLIKSFNVIPNQSNNVLKSNILNLEKRGARSVLSIAFTLVDGNNKTLFKKTYKIQKELPQNTMPSFVASISQSLETIVKQLAKDLE